MPFALGALVFCAAAAWPLGAAAETLLESTSTSGSISITSVELVGTEVSQTFMTGANPGGYTLGSVSVWHTKPAGLATSTKATLSLWSTATGDVPGSKLHDFTSPSRTTTPVPSVDPPKNITSYAAGEITFTPPANVVLSANTKYAVVVTEPAGADGEFAWGFVTTVMPGTAAAGWSFGGGPWDKAVTSSSWGVLRHHTSHRLYLKIEGAPVVASATNPVVSIAGGMGVTEGASATFTLTANPAPASNITVNVAVTDSGAFAASGQTGSRTVMISGAGTGTLMVTTDDDGVDELDGTLTATVNTGSGYSVATATGDGMGGSATVSVSDNDATPQVTLLLSLASITEEGGVSTVTATLDHASSESTVVTVSAAALAPALAGDFTLSGTMLTIAAGATVSSGAVTITANGNTVDAPDKTVTVSGAAANGVGVTNPSSKTLTITDNESMPSVTLLLSAASITEEGGVSTVTATLSNISSAETVVTVSAVALAPALAGDFTLSGTMLTIAAGATDSTGAVTITANGNTVDAPDKTVTVSGAAANGAGVTNPSSKTLTITDNEDAPSVTLLLSAASITEEGGVSTVTATLSNASSAETVVTLSALALAPALAGDFTLSGTMLTIAAGATVSSGAVTITANGNTVDAPDKTVTVSGAAANGVGVTNPSSKTLTITDNDAAPQVTLLLTPSSIAESGEVSTVTATLDHASSESTVVTVSAVALAPALVGDFTLSSGTMLTIAAGATDSTGAVTLTAVNNNVDAADKTVTVSASVVNGQGAAEPANVALTIQDDDTLGVTVSPPSLNITEGASGTYTVKLDTQPTGDVTITPSSNNPEVTLTPSSLTFTSANWNAAKTVTVSAAEDSDVANDSASVTHRVSGADYGSVSADAVAVTVTDNDAPGVTVSLNSLTITEGASETYTVVLVTQPTGNVTITPSSNNPEVTLTPSSLTFTSANWNAAKTVTVSAAEDSDAANDSASVTHRVSGADYGSVSADAVAVTVTDNDAPGVTVSLNSLAITEGARGTYTVVLDTQPAGNVTITPSSNNPEVTLTPSSLTFTSANWNAAKTVTVSAAEDSDAANDSASVTHRVSGADYGSVSADAVAVTVTDNDAPGVTVSLNSLAIT